MNQCRCQGKSCRQELRVQSAGQHLQWHIVQIFNEDHTSLITTVLAIPNYRLQPTGKTVLTYDERPADQPMALAAWFYPGDNSGQEFAYPKSEAEQLSRLNKREFLRLDRRRHILPTCNNAPRRLRLRTRNRYRKAKLQPRSRSQSRQIRLWRQIPRPPAAQAAGQGEAQLPHTASLLPLVGLIGFVLLAVGVTLRRAL